MTKPIMKEYDILNALKKSLDSGEEQNNGTGGETSPIEMVPLCVHIQRSNGGES